MRRRRPARKEMVMNVPIESKIIRASAGASSTATPPHSRSIRRSALHSERPSYGAAFGRVGSKANLTIASSVLVRPRRLDHRAQVVIGVRLCQKDGINASHLEGVLRQVDQPGELHRPRSSSSAHRDPSRGRSGGVSRRIVLNVCRRVAVLVGRGHAAVVVRLGRLPSQGNDAVTGSSC